MVIDLQQQLPVDYIRDSQLTQRNIRLGLLRLDKVHPVVSGNKWFKLKENLRRAIDEGHRTLLTFGGAYSNHLIATAAAAQVYGLAAIGVVRGFHGEAVHSETLLQCRDMGMRLHFVSREDYLRKEDEVYLSALHRQFGDFYLIPEGGNNAEGLSGIAAIAPYLPAGTDLVAVPIGTGTTFCGLRRTLPDEMTLLGFPVMKGGAYLNDYIADTCGSHGNWSINADYHFGGFARHKPELLSFMNCFFQDHGIPLDFVYTGKMMFGILELVQQGQFNEGTHVVCIHTGGLQGNSSLGHLLQYQPRR